MKYLSKILLLWIPILLFASQTIHSQSIDADRMNRDINIMENILQELFKTQWAAHGNTVQVRAGTFSFNGNKEIRGTYLPGYGVIFTIPGGPPAFVMTSDADGDVSGYTFQYGNDGDGEKVTEQTVTDRIKEFLRDYGSTMGQLSDNENIMVIYDTQSSNNHFFSFRTEADHKKHKTLPVISIVTSKENLQAFRSGDISDSQFEDRLVISKTSADAKEKLDLKVMANIFETALKEESGFRISGTVNYLGLDNFGALFSFNARYGDNSFSSLRAALNLNGSIDVRRNDDGKPHVTVTKNNDKEDDLEENQKKQLEEERNAYDSFVRVLKEYLVDYGRTLKSVKPDQYILVSVSLSSRIDEVPERFDMQIQKSILEEVDKGSMTRESALDEIRIREY